MWVRAFLLFLLSALPASAECVVLLHGLARGPASLSVLEKVLTGRGYLVVNADYPSTRLPLPELLAYVEDAVARCPLAFAGARDRLVPMPRPRPPRGTSARPS